MKAHIINLPRAKERKENIIEEMKKTPLEYEFIVPKKSTKKIIDKEGWTSGANSLRITTMALLRKAIKKKLDYLWIWEDDCVINKTYFDFVYSNLDKMMKSDFDFIHFNHSYGKRFSLFTVNNSFRLTKTGVRNCQSYIISSSVFEEYLDCLKNNAIPIDEVTKYLHQKRRKSYITEPSPVSHTINKYSYIRDQVVNY